MARDLREDERIKKEREEERKGRKEREREREREREETESESINTIMRYSSCRRIRFTRDSSSAGLQSAAEIAALKHNVYSHTTSIFQDLSTKSPVTFGFSARQVIDFP